VGPRLFGSKHADLIAFGFCFLRFLEHTMKRRILLVDDELPILLTLKAVLEINGFEVVTAISAREAEQKLTSGVYHMVITDMRMETETAGYDVIRVAKKQEYNPATAILTAYPTLGGDWRSSGAESLLVKPQGTEDLLRQIEALLIQHEDKKQAMLRTKAPTTSLAQKRAI
jgi:DNA-binding NtrC family response regulator